MSGAPSRLSLWPMLTIRAPLHPIFVHFTIALTTTSFLLDVAGRFLGTRGLADAAWWSIVGAVLATVLTIVSGVTSRLRIPVEEGTEGRAFLRLHMAIGPIVFGLIVMTMLWRGATWENAATPSSWYLGWGAIVLLCVAAQGYLGGEMVYRFGMEVKGTYRTLRVSKADRAPLAGK